MIAMLLQLRVNTAHSHSYPCMCWCQCCLSLLVLLLLLLYGLTTQLLLAWRELAHVENCNGMALF